jgi:hypothetical protein
VRSIKDIDPEKLTTLADIDEATEFVDLQLVSMRSQIEEAKRAAYMDGVYSDPNWFSRINSAIRLAGIKRQALQRRRGEMSRSMKQSKHEERSHDRLQVFADACRDLLPKETFDSIWQFVEAKMATKSAIRGAIAPAGGGE